MKRILWLITLCLGASCCVLPTAWAGDPAGHFLPIASLNLSPAQQQKMTDLGSSSQAQAHLLYGQVHKLRDKLSDLYGSYVLDPAEARRLNGELNRVQGQLLALHLSEQQQMRAVLNPEQFALLQAALKQQGGWKGRGPDAPSDRAAHEH